MHPLNSKAVLIATDDASVRDRFTAALEAAGHRARAAATPAELAATLADPDGVDLLLLDLRLDTPGGADLVARVRGATRVPILAFASSVAGAAEVRALAQAGVAGYLNEHSPPPQILPALAPHLFPDSFNRRGGPRVTLGAPVACDAGGTLIAAVASDVSRGGLGLRTTAIVDTGTSVRVRFRVPGHPAEIEAEGRVVWSDARVGLGVQFTNVAPDARRVIDAFVDANQSL